MKICYFTQKIQFFINILTHFYTLHTHFYTHFIYTYISLFTHFFVFCYIFTITLFTFTILSLFKPLYPVSCLNTFYGYKMPRLLFCCFCIAGLFRLTMVRRCSLKMLFFAVSGGLPPVAARSRKR